MPSKLVLDFSVKPDEKKDEKIKINIVNIFKDWNKTVQIVAPSESTPFENFINDSLGSARTKSVDASIKVNLANLRPQAEIFYDNQNKSYLGFCSSSELINVKKEIEGLGGIGFVCKDSKTSFVVGSKLSNNGGYYCEDSSGFSGNTVKPITKTACSK